MRTDAAAGWPRLGVGIIGCGAVTQAIHLPTLTGLGDTFKVRRVVDTDADVARIVGERAGARYGTRVEDLWEDSDVDVVAVCSPDSLHAAQVIAACESAKRAVLCEKPLCVSLAEARLVGEISSKTGVPVVTGTMHVFDPAFAAAATAWGTEPAALVRSVCLLPPNERFIALATELAPSAPRPSEPGASVPSPLRKAVLGLASHHLPLVRRFMPELHEVVSARTLAPWGYEITLQGRTTLTQMIGVLPISPSPHWTFEATSTRRSLLVEFPPSFVQAGSARATMHGEPSSMWHYASNGYVAEWDLLARVAREGDGGRHVQNAVVDFEWADRIVAAVASSLAQEGGVK